MLKATEDFARVVGIRESLAAPLIAGNDIRTMNSTTKATLTNAEVIAIDQDPMGAQGRLVASPGVNLQVWSKTLSGTNTRALALLNRGTSMASMTVQWAQIGIPADSATVRDLSEKQDLGAFPGSYTAASVAGKPEIPSGTALSSSAPLPDRRRSVDFQDTV